MTDSDFVTVREAADMSGLTERHIWRMIEQGKIQPLRDRGRVRLRRQDIPPRRESPLDELRTRLEQLERRLARLERASTISTYTPPITHPAPAASSESKHARAGDDSDVSTWGDRRKARWIAEHSAYAASSARDWPEVRAAKSEDDLRAALEAHLASHPPQGKRS